MDRASRNFLALVAATLVVGAYGLCALIVYGFFPLLEGRTHGSGLALVAVAGLGALVARSAFLATRILRQELEMGRVLSRHVETAAVPAPERLRRAARWAGLTGRVMLIDSEATCSFVYGARSPKVVLSTGLLSRLSAEELQAALEHEHYHVLRLDPLRSTVARAAVAALFFLPALRTIHRRFEVGRELAADRRAAALVGGRPLAAALLKAMEGADGGPRATISLAAPAVMDSRLLQLETGREPDPEAIDAFSLGATVLGALAFLALLIGVLSAVGGGDLSHEIGPASLLEGTALCLAPLVIVAASGYRRLSWRSTRAL